MAAGSAREDSPESCRLFDQKPASAEGARSEA